MSNGKKFVIIYGLHDDFVVLFKIISSNMVIGMPFVVEMSPLLLLQQIKRKQCWCCFHVSKEKHYVLMPNLGTGRSRFVIDFEIDFRNNLCLTKKI
jgi:hypothetical protein